MSAASSIQNDMVSTLQNTFAKATENIKTQFDHINERFTHNLQAVGNMNQMLEKATLNALNVEGKIVRGTTTGDVALQILLKNTGNWPVNQCTCSVVVHLERAPLMMENDVTCKTSHITSNHATECCKHDKSSSHESDVTRNTSHVTFNNGPKCDGKSTSNENDVCNTSHVASINDIECDKNNKYSSKRVTCHTSHVTSENLPGCNKSDKSEHNDVEPTTKKTKLNAADDDDDQITFSVGVAALRRDEKHEWKFKINPLAIPMLSTRNNAEAHQIEKPPPCLIASITVSFPSPGTGLTLTKNKIVRVPWINFWNVSSSVAGPSFVQLTGDKKAHTFSIDPWVLRNALGLSPLEGMASGQWFELNSSILNNGLNSTDQLRVCWLQIGTLVNESDDDSVGRVGIEVWGDAVALLSANQLC